MHPQTDGPADVGARGGGSFNAADSVDHDADSADRGADSASVRRAVRERGRTVARRELRTAFDQLEAQGSLTPAQRRTLTRMAAAIVDDVLAGATAAIADSRPETACTVARLFDVDPETPPTDD